jgi:hypothetical protein
MTGLLAAEDCKAIAKGLQPRDQYTQIKTIWVDLADDRDQAVA